jgi:hypothetical protein
MNRQTSSREFVLRYNYIHSNEQEVAVAGAERGIVEDLVEDSELSSDGFGKGIDAIKGEA